MSGKIPVVDSDKVKSYYKYYLEEMTVISQDAIESCERPLLEKEALKIENRQDLFLPGYFEKESGYCILSDGTGYVANLVKMPGVTKEMFDWWFVWHGLDDLRYRVWNMEDHYYARTINKEHALNQSITMEERLWGTNQLIKEKVGPMPEELFVEFLRPSEAGYDESKVGTALCASIVCGRGKSAVSGVGMPPAVMNHVIRNVENGIELRSRFWIGYTYENGNAVKCLREDEKVPEFAARELLMHNIKEFTHLAQLLPRIYSEEKTNW